MGPGVEVSATIDDAIWKGRMLCAYLLCDAIFQDEQFAQATLAGKYYNKKKIIRNQERLIYFLIFKHNAPINDLYN